MELPFYEKEKLDPAFPFLAWERVKPNFWFPFHWHAQVEIVQILSGRLDVTISGETSEGRQGDIVIVDTGLIHGYANPDPGTGARIFQFGLDIFSGILSDLRGGEQSLVFGRQSLLTRRDDGSLHSCTEKALTGIFTEYKNRSPGFRLAVVGKLHELTAALLRELPEKEAAPAGTKPKINHDRLDLIFAYIAENFDNPNLTMEMAADEARLNKFYFSRFMKEQTGQTFSEYLSHMRLHRAEQYLVESDMPVTDIAYSCGFNSIATFNRLFKTYTGTTPSAYRTGNIAFTPPPPPPATSVPNHTIL
ncbi:MAG: AraC family transcriptional regulator [Treponema sp.]|jgi:AraC-like DNA-binding protein|nr:AraC family transcriptional regulator [Treponema sp.]